MKVISIEFKEFNYKLNPYIVVDTLPKDVIHDAIELEQGSTLFYGVKDGYASFVLENVRNPRGAIDRTLIMRDGSIRHVNNAWSSRESVVGAFTGLALVDVAIKPQDDKYETLFYSCSVTVDWLVKALVELGLEDKYEVKALPKWSDTEVVFEVVEC